MSFFVSFKEILNDTAVAQIAQLSGDKPEKVQKVIDGLSVALLGGLLKRATTEYGMNLVHTQTQKHNLDATQLQTTAQTPATWETLLTNGDKAFHTLLPGVKSPIASQVAKYAGTRNSLVSSLCGVAAPVALAALNRELTKQKLDASGLANYLGNQRDEMLRVAPELNQNIVETLGIQSLLDNFTPPAVEETATVKPNDSKVQQPFLPYQEEEQEPSSFNFTPYLKWVGLAALVVGLVAGGVYFWNQRATNNNVADETDPVATSEARVVAEPAPKDTTQKAAPITATDSLGPMRAYLTSATTLPGKTFRFKGVDFEDNTPLLKPNATQPVQELANLLKANATAEVKIIAYANDAKLPLTNKMLSVKRAYGLKQKLMDAGIGFMRVDAEGLGSGVVPKDTTRRANRTPLREVYVKFIKK